MTGIRTNRTIKPLRAPRLQEFGAKVLIGFISFVLVPASSQIMHLADVASDLRAHHASH